MLLKANRTKSPFQKLGISGVSLVEASVVMGVMTASALMIAQMSQSNHKQAQSTQAKMEFMQTVNWISNVIMNDTSCKSALGLSAQPSYSLTSIDLKNLKNGLISSTGQTLTNSMPIRLYNANGTVFLKDYVSSSDNSSLQNLVIIQSLLQIQNPGAGLPVTGTTDKIYQAKLYLSAARKLQNDNSSLFYSDFSVQLNIRVNSNNKITECGSIRLGNGTNLNIPVCGAGQVVFADGTSFSCVNLGCPPNWRATSATTDSGYLAPNTDLSLVTNGGITTSTSGYNAGSGWRSGQGCTMCNAGQSNTGSITGTTTTVSGTVVCVNSGTCPSGWHFPQANDEPGTQLAGVDLSKVSISRTPAWSTGISQSTGGYNYFSGWVSSVKCTPGVGSAIACATSASPRCPSHTQNAPSCSYTLPASGGESFCTWPCGGSANNDAPCIMNYKNSDNNRLTTACVAIGGTISKGYDNTELCVFNGQNACPGGWTGVSTHWEARTCEGGTIVAGEQCCVCQTNNYTHVDPTTTTDSGLCPKGSTARQRCEAWTVGWHQIKNTVAASYEKYNKGASSVLYITQCKPDTDYSYCGWNTWTNKWHKEVNYSHITYGDCYQQNPTSLCY